MRKFITGLISLHLVILPLFVPSAATAQSISLIKSADQTQLQADTANNTVTYSLKVQNQNTCYDSLDVVIVIDHSTGMAEEIDTAKATAKTFVDNLVRHSDHPALVTYTDQAVRESPLPSDPTAVKSLIDNVIDKKNNEGDANMAAGIMLAQNELNSPRHKDGAKKVIIIFSQGDTTAPDNDINANKQAAINAASASKQDDITIVTVGIGQAGDVKTDTLYKVASPNQFYLSPNDAQVSQIYANLVQSLQGISSQTVVSDDISSILGVADFVSADHGGYLDGTRVKWNLNDIACQTDQTVHFTVRLKNQLNQPGTLSNYAVVTNTTESSQSNTVAVPYLAPQLTLTYTDNTQTTQVGQQLTYVATINNVGNGNASNFSLKITPPTGTQISSSGGGSYDGQQIVWNNLDLVSGATLTKTFSVIVQDIFGPGTSTISSTAQIINDALTLNAQDSTNVEVPITQVTPDFTTFVNCVDVIGDGTYTAYFGYTNRLNQAQSLDLSSIGPDDVSGNPPQTLQVGRIDRVFSASANTSTEITWIAQADTIQKTITASSSSTPCTNQFTPINNNTTTIPVTVTTTTSQTQSVTTTTQETLQTTTSTEPPVITSSQPPVTTQPNQTTSTPPVISQTTTSTEPPVTTSSQPPVTTQPNQTTSTPPVTSQTTGPTPHNNPIPQTDTTKKILGGPSIRVVRKPAIKINQSPKITISDINTNQCSKRVITINNCQMSDLDGGVETAQYSLDGGKSWHPVTDIKGLGTKNVSCKIETKPLADGNYSLRVRALDSSKTWGYSAPINLNVNCDGIQIGASHGSVDGLSAPNDTEINRFITVAGVALGIDIEINGGPQSAVIRVDGASNAFNLTYNSDIRLWHTDITLNDVGTFNLHVDAKEANGQVYTRSLGSIEVLPARKLSQNDVRLTVYNRNSDSEIWRVWDAAAFNQQNPIVTKDQALSLYVPEGQYYIQATKAGFYPQNSNIVVVDKASYLGISGDLIAETGIASWLSSLGHELKLEVLNNAQVLSASTLIGNTAPTILLTNAAEKIDNKSFQGKTTLVTIWNQWNPLASEQLALLAEIQKNNSNLNIVLVNTTNDYDKSLNYIARGNYPFKLYQGNNDFYEKWQVSMLPTSYLIDQAGILVDVHYGVIGTSEFSDMQTHLSISP